MIQRQEPPKWLLEIPTILHTSAINVEGRARNGKRMGNNDTGCCCYAKNVAISISIVIRFVPLSFILMNTRV